ncbi:MAG: MutS-related protein [Steroidobacteraceae bacterium]
MRLLLAALTLAAGWASLLRHVFPAAWIALPIALFIGVVLYHHRVRLGRSRAERAAGFYRRGIQRLEDRWAGGGSAGERFNDPRHVYAADLDLFGSGNLFELLCTARTRMGESCLAGWLLAPASPASIRERQQAVAELRTRVDLREHMAVLGESAGAGVYPEALVSWAEMPDALEQRWLGWVSWLLPALAVAAVIVWVEGGHVAPLLVVLLVEGAIVSWLGQRMAQVLYGVENAFDGLALFCALLERLEQERFEAAPLQDLMRRLASHTLPAARAMRRLSTIANYAGSRRNQLGQLLATPLMYSVHVTLAAQRWRRLHGSAVRGWVDALGEFEALACLATYAYEHPEDPFAELIDGPPSFEAVELAHPLIAAARCVRNDVSLAGGTRVLLVSGSNMSGKSTLLRTVGVNTVLAMAGAPVRARALRLTPLQIGASIRVNDSLQEGSSRFYAEISRIRALFEAVTADDADHAAGHHAAGPPLPAGRALLFLLDELLQGTNSTDRRVGAEGIVRAFLERGAIGLVSTHDLALTDLRGLAPGALRNVHFEDEIADGHLSFDYRLRDGVVTRSNAVALMRAIGLNV